MRDIPVDLDQIEPGLLLALFLASAEEIDKSGSDRLVLLCAYQRMVSHFQAKVCEEMTSVFDLINQDDEGPFQEVFEGAAMEIGSALQLTRRGADSDLSFALDICRRVPRVLKALAGGEIDLRRARVIVHGTENLSEATARQVVDQIIGEAAQLTSGQLYARLRKLSIQADPEEAVNRYRNAVTDRRVLTEASPDGTTHLFGLDLPPDRVAEAMAKINSLARSLKTAGEQRTIDQLRADVLLDLLDGRASHRGFGKGTIDLHVDLTTLAELKDHPGELAGYGPVIADIARQIAERQHGSEWRWTLTDPHGVVCNGTTRRRPNTAERRHVQARQPTCIFPGCRMPAHNCDLDHRHPWSQGGYTCPHNLEPLCRFHHRMRHRHDWRHQPLPDGDHLWTSPLGRRYTTSGCPP